MKKSLLSILFFMFLVIGYAQQWYPSYAPHGRDVSSSAILNANTIVLGSGFEVAEEFEEYFSTADYGLGCCGGWSVASTDTPTSMVKSIVFKDALNGYGVCYHGKMVRTSDGGISWSKVDTIANKNFFKVIYVTPQTLYIAGGAQTRDSATIIKSTDGGNTWSMIYNQPGRWLKAISFIDTLKGYAVGDSSQILKTINGGVNWTPVSSPVVNRSLNGIVFLNSTTGYIIGGIRDSVRTILKTTDGGQNWTTVKDEAGGGLNDITFINQNEGYIVGDSATVLKTTDGGQNWVPQTMPNTPATQRINTVSFYNSNTGVIGGNGGYVMFYTHSSIPEAVTGNAVMTDTVTASLFASINTHGDQAVYTLFYSTDSTFATYSGGDPVDVISNSLGVFQYAAPALIPDSTYYYFVQAFSLAGSVNGSIKSFYTHLAAYSFRTDSATNISSTTANLNGLVKSLGSATNIFFEYGTSISLGSQVAANPAIVSDTLQHSVTALLTSLQPNTSYYFRIKAITGGNTYFGNTITFSTSEPYSVLTTLPASNVTGISAQLNGVISGALDTFNLDFEYGTTNSFGSQVSAIPSMVNDSATHQLIANLNSLLSDTIYYFRLVGHTGSNVYYGATNIFYTGHLYDSIQTLSANTVTSTGATLNGFVKGFSIPANLFFEYGTSNSFGQTINPFNSFVNDTLLHSVNISLTGLQPFTTYYFRIGAQTSVGNFYGNTLSFLTIPLNAVIQTSWASAITSNSAQLNGYINKFSLPVDLSFEYGTTPALGNGVTANPPNANDSLYHNISATITGLQSNTRYYYRLKATVAGSFSVYGEIRQFYSDNNPIPNWNFENWEHTSAFTLLDWFTIGSVTKVSSYNGSGAMRLAQGFATNGLISSNPGPPDGGSPFTARPDSFIFYANYNIMPGDSGFGIVIFKKNGQMINWLPSPEMSAITGSSGGSFRRIAIPIAYNTTANPDTVTIIFMSTNFMNGNQNPLSWMEVDDLSFKNTAQNVPNHDFENWDSVSYDQALGWLYSLREAPISYFPFIPFEKSTDAQSGNYALRFQDISVLFGPKPTNTYLASPVSNQIGEPSFPVHHKYNYFNGYFKFYRDSQDTLTIAINMFKNGTQIGNAFLNIDSSHTTYSVFELPIFYNDTASVPDSAAIFISAGSENSPGNSIVYLDNFGFDGFYFDSTATGIPVVLNTGEEPLSIHIFPNPSSSKVTMLFNTIQTGKLEIFDLRGVQIISQKITQPMMTLDMSDFPNGLYLAKAISGAKQAVSRFIIHK